MEAKRIEGVVYRVKTTHGGLLVEVPIEDSSFAAFDEAEKKLARYCAKLTMSGYIITSVSRVLEAENATPRVSVLTTKEYRNEIKRLTRKEN